MNWELYLYLHLMDTHPQWGRQRWHFGDTSYAANSGTHFMPRREAALHPVNSVFDGALGELKLWRWIKQTFSCWAATISCHESPPIVTGRGAKRSLAEFRILDLVYQRVTNTVFAGLPMDPLLSNPTCSIRYTALWHSPAGAFDTDKVCVDCQLQPVAFTLVTACCFHELKGCN